MKSLVKTLAMLLAAWMAGAAAPAFAASTFTISGPASGTCSNVTFTITRSDSSAAETVTCRTVGLSAFPGQHFAEVGSTLVFAAGEASKTVTVAERNPSGTSYKYQSSSCIRSYRLEVVDAGGFELAYKDKSINYGSSYTINPSRAFNEQTVTVTSDTINVTDDGFDQACHAVPVDTYFNNTAPKDYLSSAGALLRMLLEFQAKEVNDGYQHVQILANKSDTEFDDSADGDDPGTPNHSRYLACFSHYQPSYNGDYAHYTFPVTSVADGEGASKPWSGNSVGDLRVQKFNSSISGCRASDGRLLIQTDLTSLHIRFDASGSDEGDWVVGNPVVRIQAVDTRAPKLNKSKSGMVKVPDTVVSPGPYAKGNTVQISVPFSEIVTVAGTPTLGTTWGTFSYLSGGGGNVLTFGGTITASAGTTLQVTNFTGTVRDLAGNSFSSSVNKTFSGVSVGNSHVYSIGYDLGGGTLPSGAPTGYTYESGTVTLEAPTRPGYDFAGWTGDNGSTQQMAVTIPAGSHGEAHFTAHWIKAPWPALQERLWSGGTVALTNDYTATDGDTTLTVTNAVTLDLAGHTIDAKGRFGVIEIRSGGDLTLTNSVPETGAITGGGDHGVFVGDGGVFRLRGGAIAGNASSYAGGGLFVDAGGCAWMSGGAITNNACTGYEKGGGGVFVAHDGEFNLFGGVIGGNTADEGGGVFVENSFGGTRGGYFEMVGGAISGNVAQIGGGVFLERGGEADVWDEDTEEYYQVSFDPSVFRMGGGVISGNSAIGVGSGYGCAAGIYVEYDDSLFVYGSPVVSGNTNELDVADNVRLASGALDARIGIQGALSTGALIGVTTELDPTPGYPTTVTTGAASGDSQYFFSDNPNYFVDTDEYDQVCLAAPVDVSYAEWSAANGVEGAWDATDALGIPNVFRYVFNNPSGAFMNPPLISISFDAEGKVVIHTPPICETTTGFGISIQATDTLDGQNAATYLLDASGETVIPGNDKPTRFFRLKATEE